MFHAAPTLLARSAKFSFRNGRATDSAPSSIRLSKLKSIRLIAARTPHPTYTIVHGIVVGAEYKLQESAHDRTNEFGETLQCTREYNKGQIIVHFTQIEFFPSAHISISPNSHECFIRNTRSWVFEESLRISQGWVGVVNEFWAIMYSHTYRARRGGNHKGGGHDKYSVSGVIFFECGGGEEYVSS